MADTENGAASSKKRAAGGQISKENPELDDGTLEPGMGTFQRASEEVLATRRIVKVRRQPPPSNAPANPFAGIRLVSSTGSTVQTNAQVETSDKASTEEANTNINNVVSGENGDAKVEALLDEQNVSLENNKISECSADVVAVSSAVNESPEPLETIVEAEGDRKGVGIVLESEDSNKKTEDSEGKAVEHPKEACDGACVEDGEKSCDKVGDETKEAEENNAKEAPGPAASFSSFQQLSSSQNAFTSVSGGGFGTSPFSFGSGSSFGSTSESSFSSFSFGSFNNGVTSFSLPVLGGHVSDTAKCSLQEVTVETGEENEKSVFTADATLYEYLDGSWKERGRGEVKVNTSLAGDNSRLIMRARGNYRLILNASLYPDMTLTSMDKKGITFACINIAGEGKTDLNTFALKFKDSSFMEEFRSVVTEHKGKKTSVLKTPENSPKASSDE
ncbi:hypothetical protein HPP92_019977 [Vanilla planifolia]|uniref:RanBD1 domain-containing protein n=1 Tax=Vanilla planifolia TaxID=51239 RepID=A0A835Q7I7_VANPL|nr:hypothetical protein HPP92_019977 [Vanilla planifolia]